MDNRIREKLHEALTTVLPISLIVLLIQIILLPMDLEITALFLTGALFLVVGMGFFQLGADTAMMPIGNAVGRQLVKSKKLPLTILVCFGIGALVTVAEPDLTVLSSQVPSIPHSVLIGTIAVGVGIFLVLAVLRIFLNIPLKRVLVVCYLLVIILSFFAPSEFIPVAFDSGGVTTGPMTVPFIMALGLGFASLRANEDENKDSFGLIALCSIGPILMVLLLSMFYHPDDVSYTLTEIPELETLQDVFLEFIWALPEYALDVLKMLLPLLLVFLILRIFTKQFQRRQSVQICIGFGYTFLGTTLFLTGVNVGFSPVGVMIGQEFANSSFKYAMIPVSALIGYFIVNAEPAVQILNEQVEEITDGIITKHMMKLALSAGVSVAVMLAVIRVLAGFSIYWILIPGYMIALILIRFVPSIFVDIGFDSGGVASGPMTSTFLLPMVIGTCLGLGGNIMTDAFGVIAFVAMAPIISIEIMGLIYQHKQAKAAVTTAVDVSEDDILEWE